MAEKSVVDIFHFFYQDFITFTPWPLQNHAVITISGTYCTKWLYFYFYKPTKYLLRICIGFLLYQYSCINPDYVSTSCHIFKQHLTSEGQDQKYIFFQSIKRSWERQDRFSVMKKPIFRSIQSITEFNRIKKINSTKYF